MSKDEDESTGAVAAGGGERGGRKRRRPGWLVPLLALLALLVLALLLFLLLRGGDDDKAEKAKAGGKPVPTQTPASIGRTGSGDLVAGGKNLLPVAQAGDLKSTVGKPAVGTAVAVQEVVKGQGFWIGSSAKDRVYVEFGGDVGSDEQPGTDVGIVTGDRVNVTGEVRPAPQDPAKALNLDERSAKLVEREGIFLNAKKVVPAN